MVELPLSISIPWSSELSSFNDDNRHTLRRQRLDDKNNSLDVSVSSSFPDIFGFMRNKYFQKQTKIFYSQIVILLP